MLRRESPGIIAAMCALVVSGCAATGEQYASNVYTADKVNTQQAVKTIKIIAILPAKIEVDNAAQKKNAQMIGGLLGAVAGGFAGNALDGGRGTLAGGAVGGLAGLAGGSLVNDKVLVDGVSLTYEQANQTFNSAQVGRLCEFAPGTAIMVTTVTSETRVQPNAICPVKPE